MAKIPVNCFDQYYEEIGEGVPLVFIHGAFGDGRMWDAQWQYFAAYFHVVRYDLCGHGRTGASSLDRYTTETYANDLDKLLDQLDIHSPILCGQSFGGSIARLMQFYFQTK